MTSCDEVSYYRGKRCNGFTLGLKCTFPIHAATAGTENSQEHEEEKNVVVIDEFSTTENIFTFEK